MTKLIKYVWTAEDQRIAGGDTGQSVQGPYVTPYGIRAAVIPKAATFSAGTEYEIDLDQSMSGEPWRARRFHVEKPGSSGAAYFEWHKPTIPDSVKTLSDLCKHLREKDKGQYPEAIYGEAKVKATKTVDNPAQMLFDYWENSKYRYAVVKSGFDWRTYANDPGSMPIRKDGAALEYVLRKVTPVPKAAAAPGAQRKTLDFESLAVEHYIYQLQTTAANIRNLLAVSDRVMRERYQVVYRLQALRAIAEVSLSNPVHGMASDGLKIVKAVDSVMPKVQKLLVEQPIAHPANSSEQKLGELFGGRKEFTLDVVADIQAEKEKLLGLLLTRGGEHAATIQKWFRANHGKFFICAQQVVTLVDRLTSAMADAHLALGECAGDDHDDVLFALLDRIKEGHAEKPEEIEGDSPTAIALSFVGKGVSITTTVVGNLAGPPSLSIAMLQVAGTIRFAKMAQEGYTALAALSPANTTLAMRLDKWQELSDRLLEHISDRKLRRDVRDAIESRKEDTLLALRDKVGQDIAGSAQVTVAWKGAMAVLNLISTIYTIKDALNAPDNRHVALKVLDFTSSLNSVVSVSVGTFETFVTAVGNFKTYEKRLAYAGNVIGLVGAVNGFISGIIALREAADKGNTYGMVSSVLGAGGSFGMGACIIATWFIAGLTAPMAVPAAAAVALACSLASGAVSVVEIIESIDNKSTKTQVLCRGLVLSVRKSVLGRFTEWVDATLLFGMEDLEKVTQEAFIPDAKNDYFVVLKLAKAGLSEAMIKEVVNSSALANTPFGPGPAPGLPTL